MSRVVRRRVPLQPDEPPAHPRTGTRSLRDENLLVKGTTWFTRLSVLNMVWLLQTLAGGVVLGIAPATLALAERIRGHLAGEPAEGAWAVWKRLFWRSQMRFGFPLVTVVALGFYLQLAAGGPLAMTMLILTSLYLVWLLFLPAIHAVMPRAAHTEVWLGTLKAVVLKPGRLLCVALAVAALLGALLWWVPVAVVLLVPSMPTLLAALVVRTTPTARP